MNYLVFKSTTYVIICHLFHNVIVRWWRRQCLLPRSHFISLHLRTRKQLRAHCRDKTQTISIVFGQISPFFRAVLYVRRLERMYNIILIKFKTLLYNLSINVPLHSFNDLPQWQLPNMGSLIDSYIVICQLSWPPAGGGALSGNLLWKGVPECVNQLGFCT